MLNSTFLLFIVALLPFLILYYNKRKVKGKMLCYFLRKDKSIRGALCSLRSDFVIWEDKAYDVYPDFVRLTRYPTSWPSIFQEIVPACLYLEEDAVPLDWVNLDKWLERAMEFRAALDENWLKKLVQETAPEGGFKFNLKKMLPILLIAAGVIGFIVIYMMRR